jgi:MOSC domain-containing protein YiiM
VTRILSVNVGRATPSDHTTPGVTGIDKRPVDGPVEVRPPGPSGRGGSGVAGDDVCDLRHHGGEDKAVYAFAREDLDEWEPKLGRDLPDGTFGENLTTAGIDLADARIEERWRIGDELLLEVVQPRIPCRTFAGWLAERGWVKTFTRRGRPGAYLRVLEPGRVRAGDELRVEHRPDHDVTIGVFFRAVTTEPDLLAGLLAVRTLVPEAREKAERYTAAASTL